jgi:hypothetical protein
LLLKIIYANMTPKPHAADDDLSHDR